MAKDDSPNPKIDKAIQNLMKQVEGDTMPPDVKVKIINSAISWEKVKHAIKEQGDSGWDPGALFGDGEEEDPFA